MPKLIANSVYRHPYRALWVASIGGALEMYDFVIYVHVAPVMSAMTEDAREGTQSFLDKRKPKYKGR